MSDKEMTADKEMQAASVDVLSLKSGNSPAAAPTNEDAKFGTTSASHRSLESYHVNLFALGASIGTATFVYIGSGLTQAGPLGLLLGYAWWTSVIYCIAMCQMEMVVFWPTDVAFSRNASRYIDEAWGFAVGWAFWSNEIAVTAYEVTAFTIVLDYWPAASNVNPAVYIAVILAAYYVFNVWDTRWFGNAEFGFSLAKVILSFALLAFTFVTMVGGNPLHDRFGFRFWRDPGVFTSPHPEHGANLGRFEGFLAAANNAAFTIAGPEFLTIIAGETKNPRKVMPKAFRAVFWRLILFFIGGALCVGILVPYNSPELLGAIAANASGAGKSPYVIAMNRLQIRVLPSILNAVILASVFSAGNAYYMAASRALASMARDGHAPKIFGRRNRNGVPYVAVTTVAIFTLISFCQSASSAVIALTWLTSIVTASGLMLTCTYAFTWIKFNNALSAQGFSRDRLPARSRLLPYGAYYALGSALFVLFEQGYGVFLKGQWNSDSFIYSYLSVAVLPCLFLGWKLLKKTKWHRAADVDLDSYINDPAFDENPDEPPAKLQHRILKRIF
ncbi:hypothetical protein JCM10207_004402 [Rhodosporidiobolus poonsookiae]